MEDEVVRNEQYMSEIHAYCLAVFRNIFENSTFRLFILFLQIDED